MVLILDNAGAKKQTALLGPTPLTNCILCARALGSQTFSVCFESVKRSTSSHTYPAMAKRFSMALCAKATKRPAEEEAGSNKKLPKASDIVLDPVIPSTRSTRAAHAPVVLCVYKYTNCAQDIMPEEFSDPGLALYQIQHLGRCWGML